MRKDLSIVTVAHQEPANFATWLRRAKSIADCVVVVDNSPGQHESEVLARIGRMTDVIVVPRSSLTNSDDLGEIRNAAIDQIRSEWVLVLDSDEHIAKEYYNQVRDSLLQETTDVFFLPWLTFRPVAPTLIRDYKLALFRTSGPRFTETIHQHPTSDARMKGLRGSVLPIPIIHRPRLGMANWKQRTYLSALSQAWSSDPCSRIQWFYALTLVSLEHYEEAAAILSITARGHTDRHPVEDICVDVLRSVVWPHADTSFLDRARNRLAESKGDVEFQAFVRLGFGDRLTRGSNSTFSFSNITAGAYCV